jgi:predicted phosphodiesterase
MSITPNQTPPPEALEEFIIVAGDTSNGLDGLKYLNKLKRRGHTLFAVDGNHEHYSNDSAGRTIQETEAQFYHLLDDQPRSLEVADGLKILGCNGWYPVKDERLWVGYMNDGRYAGDAAQVNFLARHHALWLRACLEKLDGKAIVVTHTAPGEETLHPGYKDHFSNQWYFNPRLGDVLRDYSHKIAVWHHGHTHAFADKIIDGVRVVCNPRGYPGENPNWKPFTMEIPIGSPSQWKSQHD